ncbi:GntR family transcriptional regulator [Acidisphaera sp. L21]|uniref:GntR family transcriptional regulator n=1 Tax=Acidisphaera sp. L21 TaxID=1641851 RepID=UPI0020B10CBE|nr:GntR family transcriptional regulator [Acidisphaera sp. L21]
MAEHLFEQLTTAIMEGVLAPGSKISEPALARQYGVSRGPLREALHRLQERKLITRSANFGARVVKPSAQALVELFVVREALEGMAARQAAMNVTSAEITALHRAAERHDDVQTIDQQHDQDFHFMIAQASRNPMLINLLCSELYPLLRLYRGQNPTSPPRSQRALIEHQRILSAIEDHDPEIAELQMRRHIAAARLRREQAIEHLSVPTAK